MHYAFDISVLPSNTISNYIQYPILLSSGIITHVSFVFPPGCARLVRCTFWNNANQLLPTNVDGEYGFDSYVSEVDCYIPLEQFGNQFYVLAWNIGTSYKHVISVLITVHDVDAPDISTAVTTLNNTIDSLCQVLKGFY